MICVEVRLILGTPARHGDELAASSSTSAGDFEWPKTTESKQRASRC